MKKLCDPININGKAKTMLKITAPTRIDLAGGTLDIFPLYLFEGGGITINMAINLETSVSINKRKDKIINIASSDLEIIELYESAEKIDAKKSKLGLICEVINFFQPDCGLDISVSSSVPKGSGLAASSSLIVALTYGFSKLYGEKAEANTLIDWCANIEAKHLGVPTGKQDYYAAYFGGINTIYFTDKGIELKQAKLSKLDIRQIEEHVVLSFTGKSHFSGANNWDIMKGYIDDTGDTREHMKRIKITAEKMDSAINRRDITAFSELVKEEWENRKKLAKEISNDKIDEIIRKAEEAGALASKICGAGGGGCLMTVCRPEKREQVINAIETSGGKILPFNISTIGVNIMGA